MTWLRGAALQTWTDVGHIGAGTVVSDTGGGGTVTYTYSGTIPCRIDALTSSEGLEGERISDLSTHTVMTPSDTAISNRNRFAIDGRGTFAVTALVDRTGQTVCEFEVVQVS